MTKEKAKTKYKVRILEASEAELWDDFVDRSQNGTLFHKYGWMKAAEKQSNTHFYPLVCEKDGEGIISAFPVFIMKKMFLKLLFSPPPGCAIPYLGPVFSFSSNKEHRIETDLFNTVEAYELFIKSNYKPDYEYLLTSFYDVRIFKWLGYKVEPSYTYRLLLNECCDTIYSNFDKNIRNKIKKIQSSHEVEIKSAGLDSTERLLNDIKQRYMELDRYFKPGKDYLGDLIEIYGDDNLNLYECIVDGQYQTSFITIEYKNNVKFWLGGVHSNRITNGIIETIHWNNIVNASKRTFDYYERVGANTRHLCENKSRYGLKPVIYFTVEKWSNIGKIFYNIYQKYLEKRQAKENHA